MYDVVLNINDLSVPDLITRARSISAAVAGAAVYAPLAAKLTELETHVDSLETDETTLRQRESAVSQQTMVRDDSKVEVMHDLAEIAIEVGKLATSEAEVEATTLRVKSKPSPKPAPGQPTGLELKAGDEDGELSGQCDGQPGLVDYYEIQFTTADPNGEAPNWQFADTSKKSSFTLEGLPSGQKVWVQLRGCNSRGKSPWSDPACKRVP